MEAAVPLRRSPLAEGQKARQPPPCGPVGGERGDLPPVGQTQAGAGDQAGEGADGRLVRRRGLRLGRPVDGVDRTAGVTIRLRRVAAGGSAIDPEVVRQVMSRTRRGAELDRLTPREQEVLQAMAEALRALLRWRGGDSSSRADGEGQGWS